jgi:hypothetical protein
MKRLLCAGAVFPYTVAYDTPTLLMPNNGLKFIGAKPRLRVGKAKPVKIGTSGATFQLATSGTAFAGE